MSNGIFLTMPPIRGDSKDGEHLDWITIDEWGFANKAGTYVGGSGGGGGGASTQYALSMVTSSALCYAELFRCTNSGMTFPYAVMNGLDKLRAITITMQNVKVTLWDYVNQSTDSDAIRPVRFILEFEKSTVFNIPMPASLAVTKAFKSKPWTKGW